MQFKQYLLEATKEDFFALAELQRDKPEKAMLKVQFAMGGGIMNPTVENIGDIIHRMSERPTFGSAGYEFVKDKVRRSLDRLTQGYGFGKEFSGNIANNAREMGIPHEEYRSKVFQALEKFAEEHEKLPTYNKAQQLAKMAAVSLGRLQFSTTEKALEELWSHLGSVGEWVKFAHEGILQ
jgi:hypothetical protein